MIGTLGRTVWAMPEGYIPAVSHGREEALLSTIAYSQ